MIILKYELRLGQYKIAVEENDDFDITAWKRYMIENDLMTANQAKNVVVIRATQTA